MSKVADPRSQLARLETASRMLAEIKTVGDARKVIGLAEAARIYARKAHLGLEAENRAAEIKIWAEWMGGEILRDMKDHGEREKAGGDRKSKSHDAILIQLDDLDITVSESFRWQRMSLVPKSVVAGVVLIAKTEKVGLATNAALRVALGAWQSGLVRIAEAQRTSDESKSNDNRNRR